MAKIIGITGNIASGKSLVGKILQEKGYKILDSDDVVHDLYENDSLVKKEILQEFGTLDRAQIAKQVFGESKESCKSRKILEAIIHPAVDRQLRLWIKKHHNDKLLFNLVPLLFEANLEDRYDFTVCIRANEDLQVKRLQQRSPDLDLLAIQSRIRSQMPQADKSLRADYTLDNNGNLDDLKFEIDEMLEFLDPS